jgi:hypothetical protein
MGLSWLKSQEAPDRISRKPGDGGRGMERRIRNRLQRGTSWFPCTRRRQSWPVSGSLELIGIERMNKRSERRRSGVHWLVAANGSAQFWLMDVFSTQADKTSTTFFLSLVRTEFQQPANLSDWHPSRD